MTIIQRAPDQDGLWREKIITAAAGARAFDALPASVAAWWPGWQLLTAYGGALVRCANADGSPSASAGPGSLGQVLAAAISAPGALQSQYASQLLDQSGHARALTAAIANAPKLYDQPSLAFVLEGLSLAMQFGAATSLTRGGRESSDR